MHVCGIGIAPLYAGAAAAYAHCVCIGMETGRNTKGEACLALCGAVPVRRRARNERRAFLASSPGPETERRWKNKRLTLCLRDVVLDDHAGIDAAGVGSPAAAAMDEGLLELPEPEVGSGCGRRLEVPAQAVAHTETISHRQEGKARRTKLLYLADKNFSRMERLRLSKARGCAWGRQQIRMRRPKEKMVPIDLGAQTNHSHSQDYCGLEHY